VRWAERVRAEPSELSWACDQEAKPCETVIGTVIRQEVVAADGVGGRYQA
jgi:hypothetical protein